MGVRIKMKTSVGELLATIDRWRDDVAFKVLPAAVNELADRAETAGVREVSRVYGLTQRDMRKYLSRRRATATALEASITARGVQLPMHLFSPRQTRKGVTVRIKGRRVLIPHSFIARMASGHVGVFARGSYGGKGMVGQPRGSFGRFQFHTGRKVRRGDKRNTLSINELYTFGPVEAWRNESVTEAMHASVEDNLDRVMQQTIRRFTR